MAKLELVGGIPRMKAEAASPVIYDERILIVDSGAGAGELDGPIASGTPITLPSAKTYTGDELEVYVDGSRLTPVLDYIFASTTEISFSSQLRVDDMIRFRIDRGA